MKIEIIDRYAFEIASMLIGYNYKTILSKIDTTNKYPHMAWVIGRALEVLEFIEKYGIEFKTTFSKIEYKYIRKIRILKQPEQRELVEALFSTKKD